MNYFKILDPKNEYVFRVIFGQNEDIFTSFFNSLYEDKKNETGIKSIRFINEEIPEKIDFYERDGLYVRAILDDKNLVKINIYPNKDLINDTTEVFEKKLLHNWTSSYVKKVEKDGFGAKSNKTITVNILNFNLYDDKESFHSALQLRNKNAPEMPLPKDFSDFEMHILEIQKFKKTNLNEMNLLEKWMLFFQLPSEKILNDLAMQDKCIGKAIETLKSLSQDRKIVDIYTAMTKQQADFNMAVQAAELKAKKDEIKKIAKNLKTLETPYDVIMKATGLSKELIDAL